MSQITTQVQNHQTQNIGNDANTIINNQPKGSVPAELQHAKPSSSVLATIGRVALGILRGIGAVATLGISELSIWGIRKICSMIRASNPQPPRVSNQKLPKADPAIDAANSKISKGLLKFNLPEQHLNALTDLLNDIATRYGDVAPKTLEDLRHVITPDGPFISLLREAVTHETEYVQPTKLHDLAKPILESAMIRRTVSKAMQQKAQDLNIPLRLQGVELATTLFMQACQDYIKGRPMGPATDTIEPFLRGTDMDTTEKVMDSFNKVTKYVSATEILGKASLMDGLATANLPIAHQTACDNAVSALRASYGQNCLPPDIKSILSTEISAGSKLSDHLKTIVKKSKTSMIPENFAAEFSQALTKVVQRKAAENVLGDMFTKDHNLTLHPKLLANLRFTLMEACPDLKEAVQNAKNFEDVHKAMLTQKDAVDAFISQVANNIKAMEQKYLPRVNAEIQPILQNFIRAMPFDDESKEISEAQVENLVAKMSAWKANIPMGDKSLEAFCTKVASELNLRHETLAEQQPQKYHGNIFITFENDSSRATWKLNNEVFAFKPQQEVIGAFTEMVPNALDQQFLSTLTNQYLPSIINEALQGQWMYSGDRVQGDERNNGLNFYSIYTGKGARFLGNFIDPGKVNLPQNPVYSITVSSDKKHAEVEMHLDRAIITDNSLQIPAGMTNHVLKIQCDLSGGDPTVRPRITSVELAQTIAPVPK